MAPRLETNSKNIIAEFKVSKSQQPRTNMLHFSSLATFSWRAASSVTLWQDPFPHLEFKRWLLLRTHNHTLPKRELVMSGMIWRAPLPSQVLLHEAAWWSSVTIQFRTELLLQKDLPTRQVRANAASKHGRITPAQVRTTLCLKLWEAKAILSSFSPLRPILFLICSVTHPLHWSFSVLQRTKPSKASPQVNQPLNH